MSIRLIFERVLSLKTLSIPKNAVPGDVMTRIFGTDFTEAQDSWILKCSHEIQPPATGDEIEEVATTLRVTLPSDFREWLHVCNGAKLFVVRKNGRQSVPGATHVRYSLFGTNELIRLNQELFAIFREIMGEHPEYKNFMTSNYLAFCDGNDGHYISLLLDTIERGKVFFLDHECSYSPYGDIWRDLYYTIAPSLGEWFQLIVENGGWGGRGSMIGSW